MTVTGTPETTFEDLRRGGLRGLLDAALADRGGLTEHERSVILQGASGIPWVNARNATEQLTHGNPHGIEDAVSALATLATACAIYSEVATAAARLITETPSTVARTRHKGAEPSGHAVRRTFDATPQK